MTVGGETTRQASSMEHQIRLGHLPVAQVVRWRGAGVESEWAEGRRQPNSCEGLWAPLSSGRPRGSQPARLGLGRVWNLRRDDIGRDDIVGAALYGLGDEVLGGLAGSLTVSRTRAMDCVGDLVLAIGAEQVAVAQAGLAQP
jgi:hypothetical protein